MNLTVYVTEETTIEQSTEEFTELYDRADKTTENFRCFKRKLVHSKKLSFETDTSKEII